MNGAMHFWHTTDGPLLYAHRGASRECPENTLPAFERALELGADVLELDVHPTRDGVFVVSHDATAARVAGVTRAISESSWGEVSGWDAGAGFVDERGARPFAGAGVRFARFDEVLARFRDVAVNVDVKDARPRDLERLLSIVREANAESRVLLTSFSYRVLSRLRALRYSGAVGLSQLDVVRLVFSPSLFDRLFPYGGVRAQIPTRSGPIDLTAPRVFAKCKRLAIGVDYWVVNDPVVANALLEHGADGIITDDPRAIAEVFRTSPRTAAWRARHAAPHSHR
jgi:glycerophosphoryl diester phosphodiesterase